MYRTVISGKYVLHAHAWMMHVLQHLPHVSSMLSLLHEFKRDSDQRLKTKSALSFFKIAGATCSVPVSHKHACQHGLRMHSEEPDLHRIRYRTQVAAAYDGQHHPEAAL